MYFERIKFTCGMHLGADIIKCALRLLALQPLKWHYFWGKCIAWIVRVPLRYRKDVVMINLARSFPEKKYRELEDIAVKFYGHLGRIIAETVWFAGSYIKNRLEDSGICHYSNLEALRELFDKAPSVMLMTSHAGNWEILGVSPGAALSHLPRMRFPLSTRSFRTRPWTG